MACWLLCPVRVCCLTSSVMLITAPLTTLPLVVEVVATEATCPLTFTPVRASIVSVTLGVATMIVVNSVMAGFVREMQDRIHGILSDVVLEVGPWEGAPDADYHMAEIRRAAGAAGDISRIVSGLPGVARSNDTVNYLIVRGGSPSENAFYVDNIEIPNINHYPAQGSSAGAIGLLNVDFIRDVQFYSGGFAPSYGNRLSSVMDIAFREGNRDEPDFQLGLDMTGFSVVGKGPLVGAKGSSFAP